MKGSMVLVTYPCVKIAKLIQRDNRFIATCDIAGKLERVHVKNTGRCKELLIPGVDVALTFQGSVTRKTDYDLIAVKKNDHWVNIDSQVPNELTAQSLLSGVIRLPNLVGKVVKVHREVTLGNSRFDMVVTTDTGDQGIVEVKGMTLKNGQLGAFPDAPSLRGLKHVNELIDLRSKGYQTYLIFIAQTEVITEGTIYNQRQPELATLIKTGISEGLEVCLYNCQVTPSTIDVLSQQPFNIDREFMEENEEENKC